MRFIKPVNLNNDSFILDVRSREEYDAGRIGLPHLHKNIDDLDPLEFIRENKITQAQTINILCHSGNQASKAAQMFENAGFDNVAVIIGGIVEAEYEGIKIIQN